MPSTPDARAFQARLERLDGLLHEAGRAADPAARSRLEEVVRLLLELHGGGLERLLDHVRAAGAAGRDVLDACAGDDVVGGMLLLHGLHPLGVEARVRQALDAVRPYLQSHGGNVELVEVRGEEVRLRLHGSCHGCPSSALTMRQTIEEAVLGKAPEVTAVRLEESTGEGAWVSEDGRARVALPLV